MPDTSHSRVIEVTEADITNGIERISDGCPIAEAITRTFPNVIHPIADVVTIRWSDPVKRKRYVFLTPLKARQFIVDFDQGKRARLKPFSIKLQSAIQIVDMRARTPAQKRERKKREKARLAVDSKGNTVRIGGRILPNMGNVQRRRRFGMRDLEE